MIAERLIISGVEPRFQQSCVELFQQFSPALPVGFGGVGEEVLSVIQGPEAIEFRWQHGEVMLAQNTYAIKGNPLDKETFKGFLYDFLRERYGKTLKWGTITGIKPVKLAHNLLIKGKSPVETVAELQKRYGISNEKVALITDIAQRELPLIYPLDENKLSAYVGVPLCPSKCAYCSFVATIAGEGSELVEAYLTLLLKEIGQTASFMASRGLSLDTLYVGGGTPSVLSAAQIDVLMTALTALPGFATLRELTFEAGRPDTITGEKLAVLKEHGVDRICLNPQSLNPDTLAAVGRPGDIQQVDEIFDQLRKYDFAAINMDLIVGLAGESAMDFNYSLNHLITLAPENITIHNLSLKKGSFLKEVQGRAVASPYDDDFYHSIDEALNSAGYEPYYLYRQKYTQGNGENVGYCKSGHPGLYNILMMAEKQTILGLGAGSSGKLYDGSRDLFSKVFTAKDVPTYINRFSEIMAKKFAAYSDRYSLEMVE